MQKLIILITCFILIVPCYSQSQSTSTSISILPGNESMSTTRNIKFIQKTTLPPKRDVPGIRFSLSSGQMYIPEYFKTDTSGNVDMDVFFLGASWCSEQNFYNAKRNGILVTIASIPHIAGFSDTTRFQQLLNEVTLVLETTKTIDHPTIRKIALSSFSGGYLGVRETLKVPAIYQRITDLVLADSLYCGYLDSEQKVLDDVQISPFLQFARDAASGNKTMWFTQLYPPVEKNRDNTTTKTAAYLIAHLKADKVLRNETNQLGMQLLYSTDTGNFHIRGYAGMLNQDHFNHFYNMAEYIAKTSFSPAVESR